MSMHSTLTKAYLRLGVSGSMCVKGISRSKQGLRTEDGVFCSDTGRELELWTGNPREMKPN